MKTKLFILILLALPAYSQTSISFYAGINPHTYLLTDYTSFLDAYWSPGLTVGLSGELFVSPLFAISTSVEYAYYGFNNYKEAFFASPSFSVLKSATGDASTEWRAFAEVKLFTKKNPHGRFYLSTGVGYVIEQIGTIVATYSNYPHDFTGPIYYENRDYFVHTLGAGERWSIASQLALDVKAQYFTNYSDRNGATIRVGLQYFLAE